jgi:hypothetical protein
MARTVQDSMRAYTPFGGRCDGEQGYEYQARYERQKRADHLMSDGGTASNFGPNEAQRKKRADHLIAGGISQRRQNLAEHVSAGGTTYNFGPNVQNRQKAFDDRCKQLRALASFRRPTTKISKFIPSMRMMQKVRQTAFDDRRKLLRALAAFRVPAPDLED